MHALQRANTWSGVCTHNRRLGRLHLPQAGVYWKTFGVRSDESYDNQGNKLDIFGCIQDG